MTDTQRFAFMAKATSFSINLPDGGTLTWLDNEGNEHTTVFQEKGNEDISDLDILRNLVDLAANQP